MRLIDANEVIKNIVAERDKIPYELVSENPFKHGNSMRGGIRKALRCIEQAPTVDAVPVVRCLDCNHWLKDVPGCTDFVGRCELANYMVGATGYCVYGERRADDDQA